MAGAAEGVVAMTAPIFLRPERAGAPYPRYCRVRTVGTASHVMACGARIDATWPITITATEPPTDLLCTACRLDLAAKRSRAVTIDLRPSVREIGVGADLEVDLEQEWGPDSEAVRSALDEHEHEDLLDVPVMPDELALADLASDPASRIRGRR